MSLHSLNPTIKAAAVIVSILILSRFFDPVTPVISLFFTLSMTFLFGRVSWKKWIALFAPFLLLALIYIWSSLWFPDVSSTDKVLWQWAFLGATEESLYRGISLGLRVLSFTALSLLFVLTSPPTTFLLSLMQQIKLPPKLAYGIMAGYRFLPIIREEFVQLQMAHTVRGVGKSRTLPAKLKQFKRYVIPLLAGAIRKAERTALAMESKGFTGSRKRTYYKEVTVGKRDWVFFFVMIGLTVLSAWCSHKLGFLRGYNGEL